MADPADAVSRLVPIPDGVLIEDGSNLAGKTWEVLRGERDALGLRDLEVLSIDHFLKLTTVNVLTVEEKENIVDQAILMFENLYPHLSFKKANFPFAHPVETLRQIRESLETLSDADFHSLMIVAFGFVVDEHTLYGAPPPYRSSIAFLPFQMRVYRDAEHFPRFVVTQVMKSDRNGSFDHPFFVPGAEVTHWNGNSADFYVENNRGRLPAGNYRTGILRGALTATSRPLTYCQMPNETEATLHYIPPGETETHAIRFPWAVARGVGARSQFPRKAFSVSEFIRVNKVTDQMMVQGLGLSPFLFVASAQKAAAPVDLQHASKIPSIFDFQYTNGVPRAGLPAPEILSDENRPEAKFGYIRIWAFEGHKAGVEEPIGTNEMVDEFRRILTDVMIPNAPDGLVLDIRGNPGGDIHAAERMLQMLVDGRIVPSFFHLANTPVMQNALRTFRGQIGNEGSLKPGQIFQLSAARAQLEPWIDSIEQSAASNNVLTLGHILTKTEDANSIGQVYRAPCVLIIDALCYSAAEIFAAGFQDHRIGSVLGVDPNTGGGGANVWTHEDILTFLPATTDLPLQPLPPGVTFTLAIRRHTRFQQGFGPPVEDNGVIADETISPSSPADLLDGFTRVIREACRLFDRP